MGLLFVAFRLWVREKPLSLLFLRLTFFIGIPLSKHSGTRKPLSLSLSFACAERDSSAGKCRHTADPRRAPEEQARRSEGRCLLLSEGTFRSVLRREGFLLSGFHDNGSLEGFFLLYVPRSLSIVIREPWIGFTVFLCECAEECRTPSACIVPSCRCCFMFFFWKAVLSSLALEVLSFLVRIGLSHRQTAYRKCWSIMSSWSFFASEEIPMFLCCEGFCFCRCHSNRETL